MSLETEYIYTETEVKHAKSLPCDDLLNLGNKIWAEVKKHPLKKDEKKTEELYYIMFDKYRDFGSSFPIVLRWMVQMNQYSTKAFKKFLLKYSSANITSKKEFLILQADYIVYLYEENKHHDKKQVSIYREFIIKQLLDEEDELKKIESEYKEKINEFDEEKRKQLYDYVINCKK